MFFSPFWLIWLLGETSWSFTSLQIAFSRLGLFCLALKSFVSAAALPSPGLFQNLLQNLPSSGFSHPFIPCPKLEGCPDLFKAFKSRPQAGQGHGCCLCQSFGRGKPGEGQLGEVQEWTPCWSIRCGLAILLPTPPTAHSKVCWVSLEKASDMCQIFWKENICTIQ